MVMEDRRETIFNRVVSNCKLESNECLIWQGSHSGNGRGGGYGRMSLDGVTMAVHRVMFICCYGPIPHKRQIDHTCNNRLCCNPDHLEMVTHKENQKRKKERQ